MQDPATEFEILISEKQTPATLKAPAGLQKFQRIINEEIQVVEERPYVVKIYVSIEEDFGS